MEPEPQDEAPNVMDLITHFYDGLDEVEVEEIDALIKTRANLTRPLR
ncbi:MAG TPA: hypothetical protein VHV55_05790 [Pirellulales bacterium]|nr:hypothetical protein [Pirellulales bacterium]